jgi:ATP-dependent RNA helicase RhlE
VPFGKGARADDERPRGPKPVSYWSLFALREGAARTAASRQTPRSDKPAGTEQDAPISNTFSSLGLHADLLRGLDRLGFQHPTPIQQQAIPPALEGRDVLASAMTGSGKTAAFALPILHRLAGRPRGTTRALVLTPTRELAAQIEEHFRALAGRTRLSSATVFGGCGMGPQERALQRGVDVVVATPGRLLDHMRSPYAAFRGLEVLVLDEADRMLDMGFLPDVRRILRQIPGKRQTLFFSATMPAPIVSLSRGILRDPVTVAIQRKAAPATGITQAAWPVPSRLKGALLAELVKTGRIRSVIAFTRTKHRANRLADFLARHGIGTGRIHGNRSQNQRTQALGAFKAGKFPVLVATDIAARGIDIDALSHVVNFDVPRCAEDYVHRVGRTARLAASGDAFLFFSPEEETDVRGIERALGQRLPRLTLPGFDYDRLPSTTVEGPRRVSRPAPRPARRDDRSGVGAPDGPRPWRARGRRTAAPPGRGRRGAAGNTSGRRPATP